MVAHKTQVTNANVCNVHVIWLQHVPARTGYHHVIQNTRNI